MGGLEHEAPLGMVTPAAAVQHSSSKLLPPELLYIEVVTLPLGSVYEVTLPTESVRMVPVPGEAEGNTTVSVVGASWF